jgi:ribonuclease HI
MEAYTPMSTNFTFNEYHLPTISRLCKELGSPREGHFAEFVWRLSTSTALPSDIAADFMRSAGYVPHRGYPLTPVDSENTLGMANEGTSTHASSLVVGTAADMQVTPAAPETVIAWTDGGARGNPGPSAYGVVIKDANGQKIAELSRFLGHQTNNVAEYQGLLAALSYATKAGYKRLQVRSDSELMVRQIRGIYRVRDKELSSLYATAMDLIRHFEWFSVDHIARSHNTEADRLVNQAINCAR